MLGVPDRLYGSCGHLKIVMLIPRCAWVIVTIHSRSLATFLPPCTCDTRRALEKGMEDPELHDDFCPVRYPFGICDRGSSCRSDWTGRVRRKLGVGGSRHCLGASQRSLGRGWACVGL